MVRVAHNGIARSGVARTQLAAEFGAHGVRPVAPMNATDVLGFPVRSIRRDELVELLLDRTAGPESTTVGYLNANTFNLSQGDANLRRDLINCDILYPDGISIVWASRMLDSPLPERMTAADFFPRFAAGCAERGRSVYLLGGAPGVAERAAARLRRELPNLRIVGARDGYFSDRDAMRVVDAINAAAPDALIIGMGSPRQERFASIERHRLRAPLRWCVGALFDYLAGEEPRGPQWLCDAGFEWLFRLAADPVGKWRRYMLGNPRFVAEVLKAKVARGRRGGGQ